MTDRLVPVAKFLTYTEAIGLYQALEERGVVALVKSCGPPSLPFGEGLFYQLEISQTNVTLAEPALPEFSEKQVQIKSQPQTCPACGSVYVGPAPTIPLWKKLVYAGTTVYECQSCRKTFFA